jgi:hypothetical protein
MNELPPFLDYWDQSMTLATYVFLGVGILILLYHEVRIIMIKDYKEKYDYVNLHEIRYFWYAVVSFIAALVFYGNTLVSGPIMEQTDLTWFYYRLFITVGLGVIIYFIFFSMVKIMYPRVVEKRLKKLRNKPRVSPDGNRMRRLSEEEEDAHLDESQIAEEANVHSVDYDVWIDEKTGYKKVEKYISSQHVEECPECGYYTFKILREEVSVMPTTEQPGRLLKHYGCDYCNFREAKEITIAKLSSNV